MIFFLILFPIGGLTLAISDFSKKSSKLAVYTFLILLGCSFVIVNKDHDSFAYAQKLLDYQSLNFNTFVESFKDLYQSKHLMDIANHIVLFVVSRFTVDHRVLFGVFAAIFGLFYLSSVNAVYSEYIKQRNLNVYLFFLFFTFAINPIVNINGFRFWTATWVFFLGAYNIIIKRDKGSWMVMVSSMLFHFSFIVPIIVFLGYKILGNRTKLYFTLLILSFLVSQLLFSYSSVIAEYLGGGAEAKISGYTGEARLDRLDEQQNYAASNNAWWYMYLPGYATFYYFLFMICYLYHKHKKLFSPTDLRLFNFTLFFVSIVNMLSLIPSMGRFKVLFYLCSIIVIVRIINLINFKKLKWYTVLAIFPFALNLMLVIRFSLDVINPYLFTIYPLYLINNDMSFYEFLFN